MTTNAAANDGAAGMCGCGRRRWQRWLAALAIACAALGATLILGVDPQEERRIGGRLIDLGICALIHGTTGLAALLLASGASPRLARGGFAPETALAIMNAVLLAVYWGLLGTKMVARILGAEPWGVPRGTFWAATLASMVLAVLQGRWVQALLRASLRHRVLCAESPGDYTALHEEGDWATSRAAAARLYGDWFDCLSGVLPPEYDDPEDIDPDNDDRSGDAPANSSKNGSKNSIMAEGKPSGTDKQGPPRVLWRTMQLLRHDLPLVCCFLVALVCAAFSEALLPYLTGRLVNSAAAASESEDDLRRGAGELLLAGLLLTSCAAARRSLILVIKARLEVRLRTELLQNLLRQDLGFFDGGSSGKLSSRVNADTTAYVSVIRAGVNFLMQHALQAGATLVFMLSLNLELTLATLATVPTAAVVTMVYSAIVDDVFDQARKRLANANAVAEAALGSMHNVRGLGGEAAELARFERKLHLYYWVLRRGAGMYVGMCVVYYFLPVISTTAVLFLGGREVLQGHLRPGELVTFMLYQQSLASALEELGWAVGEIASARGAARKVFELLDRVPREPASGDVAPAKDTFEARLELDNVTFSYPTRPETQVLHGVTLRVDPGQVVALVGPSGGGKSSVLRLLMRLYEPASGQVRLGGHALRTLDSRWLHRQVCVVGQEPVLYARSVADNIAFGLDDAPPSRAEIEAAAKQANAHDFISAFPSGYDTLCGDRGVALSGGQKQRIAIARALVRKGAVLLLDEATSALDAQSEALVQRALDDIMSSGKQTCVVVAHRLSTVRNANRIVCIDSGRIVEEGTHEDLVADKTSMYHALVSKQL